MVLVAVLVFGLLSLVPSETPWWEEFRQPEQDDIYTDETARYHRLLKAGADVEARDSGLERTPLHYAVEKVKDIERNKDVKEHSTVVALLLKAGADPKAEDLSGMTPRDLAENQLIIRLLDRTTEKDTP